MIKEYVHLSQSNGFESSRGFFTKESPSTTLQWRLGLQSDSSTELQTHLISHKLNYIAQNIMTVSTRQIAPETLDSERPSKREQVKILYHNRPCTVHELDLDLLAAFLLSQLMGRSIGL